MHIKRTIIELENFCKSIASDHQWVNIHSDKIQNTDVHVLVIFLSKMENCKKDDNNVVSGYCTIEDIIGFLHQCDFDLNIINDIHRQLINDLRKFHT